MRFAAYRSSPADPGHAVSSGALRNLYARPADGSAWGLLTMPCFGPNAHANELKLTCAGSPKQNRTALWCGAVCKMACELIAEHGNGSRAIRAPQRPANTDRPIPQDFLSARHGNPFPWLLEPLWLAQEP